MHIRPPERTATEPSRTRPRDRILLRTAGWGVGAAVALGTLVIVAQSPAGGERIKMAMAELNGSTPQPVQLALSAGPKADPLVNSLETRIAQLTGDRDRLAARVASLESNFADMTGSIRSQTTAAPTPTAVAGAPAGTTLGAAPMPMVVAVAPPMINPLATPPAGVSSILPDTRASLTDGLTLAPVEAAPSATVPLPPERHAEITPNADVKPTPSVPPAPVRARAEFGIELATAPTMENLRDRWASAKANFGPMLIGLSPVAVRDRHPGSTAVRLVAGPLPSLAAARELCARFARVNGDCWPARINPVDVVQR
jgi:hypothetical protein